MKFRQMGDRLLIRPEVGEEVLEAIVRAAREAGVESGELTGIGGVEEVELGYYDLDAKRYVRRGLEGRFELVSLVGNLSCAEGVPFVHAHAVLSGPDMRALGGHLFKARVAVTAEIWLWGTEQTLARSYDESVGLKTLDV